MISKAVTTGLGQTVETEDNINRAEVGLGMKKVVGEVILEVTCQEF